MTHRFIRRRLARSAIAGVLGALLVAVAQAANTHAAINVTPGVTTTLPPEVQVSSVGYTSGGVTYDEADLFKSRMQDYPLAIERVEKPRNGTRDWYTSNARVVITQSDGQQLLDVEAQGPYMLVRLEPGTYEVNATLGAPTLYKKHVVVLDGQTARATFVFPAGTD